jgi:mannose-6-phosphate isomerase-like protein (cupin superfamily)
MVISRRDLCSILPAMALPSVFQVAAAVDQVEILSSDFYPFDKLPVRTANNAQFRAVLKGMLATGEAVEVHETTLPPGGAPHPPHHHVHSELWLIREGTVELTLNGKTQLLGPGSVGFVHSNEEHGIKNHGEIPATYFVVAIGPGVAG